MQGIVLLWKLVTILTFFLAIMSIYLTVWAFLLRILSLYLAILRILRKKSQELRDKNSKLPFYFFLFCGRIKLPYSTPF